MPSQPSDQLSEILVSIARTGQHINTVELKKCLGAVGWSERNRILAIPLNSGNTVMHFAARYGDIQAVRCILRSIDPHDRYSLLVIQNHDGRTALHIAVYSEEIEIVKQMLILPNYTQQKDLLSVADYTDTTALDLAVLSNNMDMTLLLQQYATEESAKQHDISEASATLAFLHVEADRIKAKAEKQLAISVQKSKESEEFNKRIAVQQKQIRANLEASKAKMAASLIPVVKSKAEECGDKDSKKGELAEGGVAPTQTL